MSGFTSDMRTDNQQNSSWHPKKQCPLPLNNLCAHWEHVLLLSCYHLFQSFLQQICHSLYLCYLLLTELTLCQMLPKALALSSFPLSLSSSFHEYLHHLLYLTSAQHISPPLSAFDPPPLVCLYSSWCHPCMICQVEELKRNSYKSGQKLNLVPGREKSFLSKCLSDLKKVCRSLDKRISEILGSTSTCREAGRSWQTEKS